MRECTSNRDCNWFGGHNPCSTCDQSVGTRYGGRCISDDSSAMSASDFAAKASTNLRQSRGKRTATNTKGSIATSTSKLVTYKNKKQQDKQQPSRKFTSKSFKQPTQPPVPNPPRAPGACMRGCTSDRDCNWFGGHNPCSTCDQSVGTRYGGRCISDDADATTASA